MEDKKPYVMLYWDILNKLDNPYELSVYVYLRKHADHATGTCYPSIATLEKETKISEKKIRLILKDLKDKKLITIQNRTLVNGGKTSNIYKLLEFENEEIQAKPPLQGLQDEKSEQRKRVSGMDQADQSESKQDTQLNNNANLQLHDNTEFGDSQAKKVAAQTKYDTEEIKKKYDYAAMIAEKPEKQTSIDICMDIISTTINSKKKNIRIQKEEIPKEKVTDKLLKLTKDDILWAIGKYEQQPTTVHYPKAYLLTLLYDAKNQRILDLQNQKSVAAAAAAPPKAQTKAVASGTQAFQNFTERKNNKYMEKILGQYSLHPEDQAQEADVGEESAL
jgi:GntR family transcriptional regulator